MKCVVELRFGGCYMAIEKYTLSIAFVSNLKSSLNVDTSGDYEISNLWSALGWPSEWNL